MYLVDLPTENDASFPCDLGIWGGVEEVVMYGF